MRQIFLDTETTGLNPESGDRIVEIGCIEMVNRRLTHTRVADSRRQSCRIDGDRRVGAIQCR